MFSQFTTKNRTIARCFTLMSKSFSNVKQEKTSHKTIHMWLLNVNKTAYFSIQVRCSLPTHHMVLQVGEQRGTYLFFRTSFSKGNQQTCFTNIFVSQLLYEVQTSFCAHLTNNESLYSHIDFIVIGFIVRLSGNFYQSFWDNLCMQSDTTWFLYDFKELYAHR